MSVLERKSSRRIFFGEENDALVTLIIINLVVTGMLFVIRLVYQFGGNGNDWLQQYNSQIATWFTLPSNGSTFLSRPWTLLTHMFSHTTIWSLLASMLWLWAFGYILQDLAGNRKLAPLYLYGGVAGGLIYAILCNIFPKFGGSVALYGSGASIMAIALATTMVAPNYRIFPLINGGIPLWILTALYVLIDIAAETFIHPVNLLAHVGGAAVGFLFINRLRKGHDWGEWMHQSYRWFFNLFNPDKLVTGRNIKKEVFYNTKGKLPFTKTPNITQQRVDELLDKINLKGYHFLSDEEKELLRKASEEDL